MSSFQIIFQRVISSGISLPNRRLYNTFLFESIGSTFPSLEKPSHSSPDLPLKFPRPVGVMHPLVSKNEQYLLVFENVSVHDFVSSFAS